MNNFKRLLEFRIATMGIRVLVLVIVWEVCVLNLRSIAAWPSVVASSRFLSDRMPTGHGEVKFPSHGQLHHENPLAWRTDEDWSELLLTIQWPETFCLDYNDTHNGSDKCVIPQSIKKWTIHGLWPSSPGSEGPAFCNNSWTFDPKNVTDLEQELNDSWPSFIISEPHDYLWKHEWDKHGTCAASLPALYGEHNYFQKTLDLYKKFDMYSLLKSGGVTPTMEMSYSYGKIFDAVTKGVGKNTTISCLYDEKNRLTYLSEIELCFDKQFNLIDCRSKRRTQRRGRLREENCSHDQLIFYPPMNGM